MAVGDEMLTVIACWRPFEQGEIVRLDSCESTNEIILTKNVSNQGDLVSTPNQTLGEDIETEHGLVLSIISWGVGHCIQNL